MSGNGKKKSGNSTTALAKVGDQEYAILKAGIEALPEILQENIGAEGLSSFELDRIKIPAGGMQAWSIPTVDGEEVVKEFTGVIIYHKLGRVLWKDSLEDSGGGSPPDCSSDDSVTGIGDPGGDCAKCAFARFGSDPKGGKGQACKQVKQLFVMRANALLPVCVSLPPTSLAPAKKFLLRLASNGLPYYAVLVKFGLEKVNNTSGIEYSRAVLSVAQRLAPEQAAQFKQYSQSLRPHLDKVRISEEDYAGQEAADEAEV